MKQNMTIAGATARRAGCLFGSKDRPFQVLNPLLLVLLGGGALMLSGCGQEEVRVYQAPKEASPPSAAAMTQPPALGQAEAFKPEEIVYQTPADWHPLAPGPMRHALFAVSGSNDQEAQMSIMALPGMAGGEFENVNRWRGQVGLGPIKPEELKSLTETIAIGNLTGHLFDLAGPSADAKGPLRMVVAMLEKEGNSWFFKMVGADALVKKQKPVFIDFLKSIQFRDTASPLANTPAAPSTAAVPTAETPAAPAAAPGTPSHWKVAAPGPFQKAKFSVAASDGGAPAEVTISELAGDGGGLLANVNRWRRQLGLAAVEAPELASLTNGLAVGGSTAVMVDMANAGKPTRMLTVVVPAGGQTIFYKLTGPPALVEREKATFINFIQSMR